MWRTGTYKSYPQNATSNIRLTLRCHRSKFYHRTLTRVENHIAATNWHRFNDLQWVTFNSHFKVTLQKRPTAFSVLYCILSQEVSLTTPAFFAEPRIRTTMYVIYRYGWSPRDFSARAGGRAAGRRVRSVLLGLRDFNSRDWWRAFSPAAAGAAAASLIIRIDLS